MSNAQIKAQAERNKEIAGLYDREEEKKLKNNHFDLDEVDGDIEKKWKEPDPEETNHIERHFKFYEIENTLKQICFDQMEPIR